MSSAWREIDDYTKGVFEVLAEEGRKVYLDKVREYKGKLSESVVDNDGELFDAADVSVVGAGAGAGEAPLPTVCEQHHDEETQEVSVDVGVEKPPTTASSNEIRDIPAQSDRRAKVHAKVVHRTSTVHSPYSAADAAYANHAAATGGPGNYDCGNVPTGQEPPKRKRKTTTSVERPKRPLSAYNLYYRFKR